MISLFNDGYDGRVVRTGEPTRFENAASGLDRHFDVFAFRVDPPERHQVAVLFNDITAKERAKVAMLDADRRKFGPSRPGAVLFS